MHGMVINVLQKRVLVKEIFHVVVMVVVQPIHLNVIVILVTKGMTVRNHHVPMTVQVINAF